MQHRDRARVTARLGLICQGPTRATRAAAFGGDEPLEDRGRDALARARRPLPQGSQVLVGPARAAAETAAALGLDGRTDGALADPDFGAWQGRTLAFVAKTMPDGLASWLTDPGFDGHGGESRVDLRRRTGDWLAARTHGRWIGVTNAAFIRMAVLIVLDAPAHAFWSLDIAPSTLTDLRHDGRRWTLRACGTALRGPADAEALGRPDPPAQAGRHGAVQDQAPPVEPRDGGG